MSSQIYQLIVHVCLPGSAAVRVDTHRRKDNLFFICQVNRRFTRLKVNPGYQDTGDPPPDRPLDHFCAIFVKAVEI
jgi:hypothetical protein